MTTEVISGVWLKPLDTLFFRDGRPFDATSRVESGLPQPQTVAGALRTALLSAKGFDFRKFAALRRKIVPGQQLHAILSECHALPQHIQARFRGPWLALRSKGGDIQPLLPVPQTTVADETGDNDNQKLPPTNWRTLLPRDPQGCRLPGWLPGHSSLWPLWRKDIRKDAKRPSGFLTSNGIRRFLDQVAKGVEELEGLGAEYVPWRAVYDHHSRIGIAVNADTLTSSDGMLYGIDLLSLPDKIGVRRGISDDPYRDWEIGVYVEVVGPSDVCDLLHERPIPIGGEGRHVQVTVTSKLPEWPHPTSSSRSVLYMATPGIFTVSGKSSWLPDALSAGQVTLRGAASDKAIAVSGWDIARNAPKPTRFAVPAGAIYFVEGQIKLNHSSLCSDTEDVAQGWGYALQGDWK